MIMYRTKWHRSDHAMITPFEVVKETAKQVVYIRPGLFDDKPREDREAKKSDYQNWFATWDEAHQFLLKQQQYYVETIRNNLLRANGTLERIKGMHKPEGA
jgi:hypothetical protein